VRSVTDPFLLSANDDELAPEPRPTGRNAEQAHPRGTGFVLDEAEIRAGVARSARRWAPLVARIHAALETAGFHQHDPYSEGGGYHTATHVRDDGVLICWAARYDDPETLYQPDTYERAVERIMNPVLLAIVTAAGFAAWQIPDEEDNGGCIVVTGSAA
jgi:hypothetical protein